MNKINISQQSEIVQLYLTGDYSQAELGELYGVSGVAIYKILKKHNIPGRSSWGQTEYRKCSQCGMSLPMSEFYRNKDYWCKTCASKYYKDNRNYDHNYKKYGMSESDYLDMLEKQKDQCAICGKAVGKSRLSVDHDHETGKVRGLLCQPCNIGLGFFDEDVEALQNAINYLQL